MRLARCLMALSLLLVLPQPGLAVDRGRQVVVTKPDDAARLMDAVENAVWAADGTPASKAVYVVYSTDCAWSKRLFDDTRALAGNVQLRWIPVAGSTAASVVAGRDAASVANAFAGRAARAGDASAQRALVYNHGVMDSITYQLRPYDRSKTFAFPTLVYRSGKSVKVVAGNPRNWISVDGVGENAAFGYPQGLTFHSNGSLYLADTANKKIRIISPERAVTTLALKSIEVPMEAPHSMAFDSAGNLYVSDRNLSVIHKITPDGVCTVFAGSPGQDGHVDGVGRAARFRGPCGLVVDSEEAVAARRRHRVRRTHPFAHHHAVRGRPSGGTDRGLPP